MKRATDGMNGSKMEKRRGAGYLLPCLSESTGGKKQGQKKRGSRGKKSELFRLKSRKTCGGSELERHVSAHAASAGRPRWTEGCVPKMGMDGKKD